MVGIGEAIVCVGVEMRRGDIGYELAVSKSWGIDDA